MSTNYERLWRGEIVSEGTKILALCHCGKIVRLNKPFFGGKHLCHGYDQDVIDCVENAARAHADLKIHMKHTEEGPL